MISSEIIYGDVLTELKRLLDTHGEFVHLIVTSPPYNIGKDYTECDDSLSYDAYLSWMEEVWSSCKDVLVSGGRLCVNIGENKRQDVGIPLHVAFSMQLVNLKMLYRGTIIWDKNSAAKHCAWGSWRSPSNPHVVPRHEYILVFSKDCWKLEGNGESAYISADEFMTCTRTVWRFPPAKKSKVGHPAPFPLELPQRLIQFYTFPGQVVLDPFSGSGTTGLAAKRNGRTYVLIDNSLDYYCMAKNLLSKAPQ